MFNREGEVDEEEKLVSEADLFEADEEVANIGGEASNGEGKVALGDEADEKVGEEDVEANIEGEVFDGEGEVIIEMIGDEADEYENNEEEEDGMKRKTAVMRRWTPFLIHPLQTIWIHW